MSTNNKEIIEIIEIIDIKGCKGHQGFAVQCIRGLRDMKQAELAELIGVSINQMYKIEKQPIIDKKYTVLIADTLKVDIDTIINFHTDCEINVFTFNDKAQNNKANYDSSTNNNGVSIEKFENLYERLLAATELLAKKDKRISELENKKS